MLELTSSHSEGEASLNSTTLPIGSIVRALCQAANAGPDLLYEVMLKLSLLVEATAPMYGLSIWTVDDAQKPTLNWAEGLDETELAVGESVVQTTLSAGTWPETSEGDPSICFVLASSKPGRPGAALYGLCVRPLTERQARDLGAIIDVTRLAHSHVSAGRPIPKAAAVENSTLQTTLPGMIFAGLHGKLRPPPLVPQGHLLT